jgi:ATP synthase protein I
VDNSLTAGRRLAVHLVLAQAGTAIIVGLLFLVGGAMSALAALGGGLAVAVGTALLALRVFAWPLAGPGATVARFALGTLLKWSVVLGGLYLMLVHLRLPPVPALAGVGAAVLVNWLALRFDN